MKCRETGNVFHFIVIVLLGHHRFQPGLADVTSTGLGGGRFLMSEVPLYTQARACPFRWRGSNHLKCFQDVCIENSSRQGHNLALTVLCVVKRREVGDVVHFIVIVLLGHHRFQPEEKAVSYARGTPVPKYVRGLEREGESGPGVRNRHFQCFQRLSPG